MSAPAVVLRDVACRYGPVPALERVSLAVERGAFVGLVGPNGSGKTTVLRAIAGLVAPERGTVLLDGQPVAELSARQLATRVAFVPQHADGGFGFTVHEIVLMGRAPHLAPLAREGEADLAQAREAMERTRTWHLRRRRLDELSGGERQRVLLARALAQGGEVLLLDEPTAHLDLRFQLQAMALAAEAQRAGRTVLVALHDLNLAALFCPWLVLLHRGRVVAAGPPAEVLTPARVREVYGVEVEVRLHPATGRPALTVLGQGVAEPAEK
ncbi:MAG TPA: ABC transporter ATP-binding protein [bacterium]|nr:ABC transporter ATP-binding protein [bacterium]